MRIHPRPGIILESSVLKHLVVSMNIVKRSRNWGTVTALWRAGFWGPGHWGIFPWGLDIIDMLLRSVAQQSSKTAPLRWGSEASDLLWLALSLLFRVIGLHALLKDLERAAICLALIFLTVSRRCSMHLCAPIPASLSSNFSSHVWNAHRVMLEWSPQKCQLGASWYGL